MLVQVYVDDIIFGSTNKSWCDEFEALMKSRFQMSSMGELTFFLGLQVKQNKGGIFISQDKYVAEILKKFDLVNVKAAITPMETKVTPKTSHLNAVKRIFKYLKGKPNLGLWYPRESPFDLEAFSDSDYGGSNLDRKSTTGGCQFLGQRLISWQCKKQTIVATSTTEAEYVLTANCCGQTATTNTIADGTLEIHATIDTIGYTITEASIRDTLQLADATGITMLPNDEIFEGMGQRGVFEGHQDLYCLLCYLLLLLIQMQSKRSADTQSQPSSSTLPVPSTSSPPVQSPPPIPASIPTPTPIPETEPAPFEHTFEEPSPVHQHFSPPQEQAHGQMTMDDLLQVVPQLISRIDSLETDLKQTKLTMGNALVKLVKKVKKLEGFLKRRNVVLSDSKEEEPEAQGRKIREGDIREGKRLRERSIKISTISEQVSTGNAKRSIPSPDKGQRVGKAPMISEETPKKSKEQILQEEASLTEAIRLDTLQKEDVAKQVHLDSLLAQRIAEEEELNEQQKKRRAQVQFEAQHYTDEDWDLIRAKIEANAELSKSMLGSDLQGEDFAKKMVDLVNQRKKYFAEERARAKRNKPMTQSQLKTYMMNYLKNQGTWKLSQLKNLSFEEVKKFDKLVKQVESFAPMNFEATKASLKRFGEELQTKTSKRLKSDEAKDAEPAKKSGKRRKQMARKGLHTDLDKDDSEGSDEVSEQDDSVSGTKIPINPVPVAMKSPSIATYKIIRRRKRVYQKFREYGTDIYGMDGPEDELEKVFWKYLKNMFEEPLSTDPIWSLLSQQRIISWRYYDTCRVHCLNLESMDIYMLIERKYPLSAEICKTMLNKKLQGGKPDEDCYKMLKMMEKQAGLRRVKSEELEVLGRK
ncbi:putative ribonuclease H-like domain-containing protein [Tanacetum coccineum]